MKLVKFDKFLMPFKNKKGEGDERDTVSLMMKLIVATVVLAMISWLSMFLIDTAKQMQNKEAEIRQQQNESINFR